MVRRAITCLAVLGLSIGMALADGNEMSVSGKISQISCGQSMLPDCGVKVKHKGGC